MVNSPRRGEVWWAEMADKRRPVLVLTRDAAIPLLHRVIVAPITSRVREIPTEVLLGLHDGMAVACAISLDNLTVAPKSKLVERTTTLSRRRMAEVCVALRHTIDC